MATWQVEVLRDYAILNYLAVTAHLLLPTTHLALNVNYHRF